VLSPKKQVEIAEHKLFIFLRGGPAFCCGYDSQTWRSESFERLYAHPGNVLLLFLYLWPYSKIQMADVSDSSSSYSFSSSLPTPMSWSS